MYIHRIILRDVRNFEKLDMTLRNGWTDKPLDSVLLTGPNGSGKTTILRVIAALWENFSVWMRLRKALTPSQHAQKGLLLEGGLAAIEIREFINYPIWLYVASNQKYRDELQEMSGETGVLSQVKFIGEVRSPHGKSSTFEPQRTIPFDNENWLDRFDETKKRLEIGANNTDFLPNFIFLEADNRTIKSPSVKHGFRDVYPETIYRWMVNYEAQDRFQGHIESMFQNVKIRDPENFKIIRDNINQFLGVSKKITDFDDNLRLLIQVVKDKEVITHLLDELSAGERQCVILMFMVSRWLMRGGVVLIDEPDLHLHVSLQRHFIHELEKVVHSKGGQLIVTSHSPTTWQEFGNRQIFNLVEDWQPDAV